MIYKFNILRDRPVIKTNLPLLKCVYYNSNPSGEDEEGMSSHYRSLVEEYKYPFEHLYAGKEDNEVPKKAAEINQYLKDHNIESNV